jgi:hypothetical protein
MGNRIKRGGFSTSLPNISHSGSRCSLVKDKINIIISGTGDGGKSTISKLLNIIYHTKETSKDVESFRRIFFSNILSITEKCINFGMEKGLVFENAKIYDVAYDVTRLSLKSLSGDEDCYNTSVHELLLEIWLDPIMLYIFENHRSDLQLPDGACEFVPFLKNITNPREYALDFDDYIRCRVKTIGLARSSVMIHKKKVSLFDVGGQRSERLKWKRANYDVIFYMASLNDFDLLCYEDNSQNRMIESLNAFEDFINSENTVKDVFLIFTKVDVFKNLIQTKDLSNVFKDYDGGRNWENALDFISKKFIERNHGNKGRLHVYTINLMDIEAVTTLFEKIFEIIAPEIPGRQQCEEFRNLTRRDSSFLCKYRNVSNTNTRFYNHVRLGKNLDVHFNFK